MTHTPLTIELTPCRTAISREGGTLDVLIRVQAPALPPARRDRPPLHLALVVDRSGSMAGQPLREALRCAENIITHLSPVDRAALVVYDTDVRTLVPLTAVVDPAPFVRALRSVTDGGSTALHAGWLEGANQLAPQTGTASLSRVLLLSDGQANVGETDVTKIADQCRALAGAGVTTTTIGLGRNFNEDLMVAMARHGGGQHYYGQTAADLEDAFREEFDLVRALYARNLTASLHPGPGVVVEITSVPGVLANAPVPLSDVAYGAEVWLLARLHYAAKPDGNHTLLAVGVKGQRIDGGPFETRSSLLELPTMPELTLKTLPTDDLVTRRKAEVETANLYDEVRSALRSGDRTEAKRKLEQAKSTAQTFDWMERSVDAMETLIDTDAEMAVKEALFQAEKARRRQAPIHESAVAAPGEDTPTYLRRKTESGKRE
ncbi:MAG: VWA domain-containing protein [Capsulimonadales bacterium]|nr:VWA domain-containing protein [Capsulimonadales bacterium]